MSEQENEKRGLSRGVYIDSQIVATTKSELAKKKSHDEIATSLLDTYPAKKIALDLTHTVDVVNGLEERLNVAQLESTTDALTGLLNRRSLDDQLSQEMKWMSEKSPKFGENMGRLSYILFDIDHFKLINDEYGHAAGDFVLREIGSLTKQIPDDETIPNVIKSRLGGEEFVLVTRNYAQLPSHLASLPNSDKIITGTDIAEILRQEIQNYPFIFREGNSEVRIPVTASFGVAGYDFGGYKYTPSGELISELKGRDDEKDLYKRADDALYYSKRHKSQNRPDGRNQVTVYKDAKSTVPFKETGSGFRARLKDAYHVLTGKRKVR